MPLAPRSLAIGFIAAGMQVGAVCWLFVNPQVRLPDEGQP